MEAISRAQLQTLASRTAGVLVSIFMPAHRAGAGAQQDPIRFRHLLAQAEAGLLENGFTAYDARRFLEPARQLAEDSYFWRHQGDGLAVFVAPDWLGSYSLPLAVGEQVVLAPHFYLRPLLPLLHGAGRFYVLALRLEAVRLFRCAGRGLEAVELPGLPRSRAAALMFESPGKHIAPRTVGAAPGAGARPPAMFYSSGGDAKPHELTIQYFRQVDKALRGRLRDDPAPVILAGVEYLHAMYRGTSRSPSLAGEGIYGSLEGLSSETIEGRARDILQAHLSRQRQAALESYRKLARSPRAAHDIRTILPAAFQQRVETLFVDSQSILWGNFEPVHKTVTLRRAERRAGDEDLINLAAIYALSKGGAIWVVEPGTMPAGEPVAAILRT